jgi:hypothetical protein
MMAAGMRASAVVITVIGCEFAAAALKLPTML